MRMAMIVITTMTSTSVKPRRPRFTGILLTGKLRIFITNSLYGVKKTVHTRDRVSLARSRLRAGDGPAPSGANYDRRSCASVDRPGLRGDSSGAAIERCGFARGMASVLNRRETSAGSSLASAPGVGKSSSSSCRALLRQVTL
jgi:hypothetical protein